MYECMGNGLSDSGLELEGSRVWGSRVFRVIDMGVSENRRP